MELVVRTPEEVKWLLRVPEVVKQVPRQVEAEAEKEDDLGEERDALLEQGTSGLGLRRRGTAAE
jgi:hypothetical protein